MPSIRIFVSYARGADAPVASLVDDLRHFGHDVFYDQELAGGQQWWPTLLDQIEHADAFLPVLSAEYRSSPACTSETRYASDLGIPFIPIDLGDGGNPELYNPAIAEANWVRYSDERDAIRRLSRALNSLPPARPPTDPPPRPAIPISYFSQIQGRITSPADIPRQDQALIVTDLQGKLATKERGGARQLLEDLRARPDVTFEMAGLIDEILRQDDIRTAAAEAVTNYGTDGAKSPPIPRWTYRPNSGGSTRITWSFASIQLAAIAATAGGVLLKPFVSDGRDDRLTFYGYQHIHVTGYLPAILPIAGFVLSVIAQFSSRRQFSLAACSVLLGVGSAAAIIWVSFFYKHFSVEPGVVLSICGLLLFGISPAVGRRRSARY